jgi:hypothetical protein
MIFHDSEFNKALFKMKLTFKIRLLVEPQLINLNQCFDFPIMKFDGYKNIQNQCSVFSESLMNLFWGYYSKLSGSG